ncbi:MAG: response regulator [Rhodospirillales bacterium]|nr:response regulator [Rhodospirillales bacterium]
MPNHAKKITVLLVEDHAPSAKIGMTLVEELGCTCEIATTGNQAVTLFSQNSYDLVLLDLQLPDMNGLDVARHMRRQEQDMNRKIIPIVGMTGCSTEDDRLLCEKAGMNDHLPKPFRLAQLEDIIQTYC